MDLSRGIRSEPRRLIRARAFASKAKLKDGFRNPTLGLRTKRHVMLPIAKALSPCVVKSMKLGERLRQETVISQCFPSHMVPRNPLLHIPPLLAILMLLKPPPPHIHAHMLLSKVKKERREAGGGVSMLNRSVHHKPHADMKIITPSTFGSTCKKTK